MNHDYKVIHDSGKDGQVTWWCRYGGTLQVDTRVGRQWLPLAIYGQLGYTTNEPPCPPLPPPSPHDSALTESRTGVTAVPERYTEPPHPDDVLGIRTLEITNAAERSETFPFDVALYAATLESCLITETARALSGPYYKPDRAEARQWLIDTGTLKFSPRPPENSK